MSLHLCHVEPAATWLNHVLLYSIASEWEWDGEWSSNIIFIKAMIYPYSQQHKSAFNPGASLMAAGMTHGFVSHSWHGVSY